MWYLVQRRMGALGRMAELAIYTAASQCNVQCMCLPLCYVQLLLCHGTFDVASLLFTFATVPQPAAEPAKSKKLLLLHSFPKLQAH